MPHEMLCNEQIIDSTKTYCNMHSILDLMRDK